MVIIDHDGYQYHARLACADRSRVILARRRLDKHGPVEYARGDWAGVIIGVSRDWPILAMNRLTAGLWAEAEDRAPCV